MASKAVSERPDGRGHKLIQIDELEAEVVRKAAEFILQGLSSEEVCHRLNGLGLLPRNAPRWDRANLRRALKAPYLKGEFTFAKSETPQHRTGYGSRRKNAQPFGPPIPMIVPAILDEATWEAVQRVLGKRATGKIQRVYTLSGHLYGECGFAYTGVFRKGDSRNVRYYQCRTQCDKCRTRRVRADQVEDAVWEAVCGMLSQPDRLLAMAAEFLNIRQGQVHVEAEQLALVDAKIQTHERAIADTTKRAALSGDLFSKSAETAIAELEESLGALLRHRQQLEAWQTEGRAQSERKRRLWELADGATTRMQALSPKEKRKVLQLLDVKVVVGDERPPMHLNISGTVYDDALAALESGQVEVGRQAIEP